MPSYPAAHTYLSYATTPALFIYQKQRKVTMYKLQGTPVGAFTGPETHPVLYDSSVPHAVTWRTLNASLYLELLDIFFAF